MVIRKLKVQEVLCLNNISNNLNTLRSEIIKILKMMRGFEEMLDVFNSTTHDLLLCSNSYDQHRKPRNLLFFVKL